MSTRFASARPRIFVISLLLVGSAASCAWAQAANDPAKTAAPPAGKPADGEAQPHAFSPEQVLRRLWWNQTAIVDELKLTTQQRESMDKKFLEVMLQEREARSKVGDLRRDYDQALRSGHWAAARQATTKLLDEQKVVMEKQYTSRIDVLSLLTDEQLQSLQKSRPRLLLANWMSRGGSGGADGGDMMQRRHRQGGPGGPGGQGGRRQGPGGKGQNNDDDSN